MSQSGQNRTLAPPQNSVLFNHLVGNGEQVWRNIEADHPRSPEVESEFKLGGLLHWKIGRLLTAQDAIDILGRVLEAVLPVDAVENQGAGCHRAWVAINCRHAMA
jgi:hypothetical protein